MAELAEAVTELEESSHRASDGHTNGRPPVVEEDLLAVKDDLAAEFADELRAAAAPRPAAH